MVATYTNFCCRSGGSNLNAGTLLGDTTEPAVTPSFAYDGTFATNTFTVTAGRQVGSTTDPQADGVTAGMFVHVNNGTATGRLARIASVTTTTIVLDATATVGSGTGAIVANVGGAFLGPNGAVPFLDSYPSSAVTNVAANPVRMNLKNDQTYSITAAINLGSGDVANICGYETSYGDLGRAVIDGGTSGASYNLLWAVSGSTTYIEAIEFRNNGATGSTTALPSDVNGITYFRVVCHDVRGHAFHQAGRANYIECEVYNCNQSNTANLCAFLTQTNGANYVRCIAHDNSGSNTVGFKVTSGTAYYKNCIADSNGNNGFYSLGSATVMVMDGCDSYSNGGSGASLATNGTYVFNCNFVNNTLFGIACNSSDTIFLNNCGFGSGTEENGSGATSGNVNEIGSVTYAADTTPWADPADGNFSITGEDAKNAGRGTFLQTQAGYGDPDPTVAYPDIGAGQHEEVPAAGALMRPVSQSGGLT